MITMTGKEKLQAIRALMNGEYDNPHLASIGFLHSSIIDNINTILNQPNTEYEEYEDSLFERDNPNTDKGDLMFSRFGDIRD